METEEDLEQPQVVHDEPCVVPGDERRGTLIDTPFDRDFVEAIKERFQYRGERAYEDELWWVIEGHEEAVEELVIEHFGGCRVVHADGSETLRDRSGNYEQGGLW